MSLSIPTISLSDVLNAVVLNNTTLLRVRLGEDIFGSAYLDNYS